MHYLGSTVDDVGSTSQQLRDHPDISSFCRTNECVHLFKRKEETLQRRKHIEGLTLTFSAKSFNN